MTLTRFVPNTVELSSGDDGRQSARNTNSFTRNAVKKEIYC